MKKIRKLVIMITAITIVLIVYGIVNTTLVSESGGSHGNLDLFNTSAKWYTSFSASEPYYENMYKPTGYNSTDTSWFWRIYDESKGINLYGYDEQTLLNYKNIYCVQHSKVVACPALFATLSAKIEIRGTTATWKILDQMGNVIQTETYEADINNIMAAVLSDEPSGSAYGTSEAISYRKDSNTHEQWWNYTDQQKALYDIWNDWVKASGVESLISTYVYAGNDLDASNVWDKYAIVPENVMESYIVNADDYTYNVDIYYLDVQFGETNNTWGGGTTWTKGQNVIVVDRDPPEPKKIDISVEKVWNDSVDTSNRPESISVNLLLNDSPIDTLVLNAKNSWKGEFTELEDTTTYTIEEINAPTGYYEPEITGDAADGFTITNTLKTTSVKVNKIWSDDNNRDGIRPTSVTAVLCENGTETKTTATLNADNNWSYTFTKLPQYKNKKAVTYTVKEQTVPTGYTDKVTGNASSGFTITNTHTPEKITISGSKTWSDDSNRDGKRPSEIMIRLKADGTEVANKTVTPDANGNWSWTFTDLYKYRDGGTAIVYTITEDAVTDYTTKINGYNVTNTHVPERTEVTVSKVWDDDTDRDGIRPSSVILTLYGDTNGDGTEEEISSAEVSGTNNTWTHTFTNLLKYRNGGTEITYRVDEETANVPTGYTKTASGLTVTNKHIPEQTKVKVIKDWEDEDNLDDLRVPITITLYEDGNVSKNSNGKTKTVVLNESNNWTAEFTGLYKYKENGTLIEYTVKETVPDYYEEVAEHKKELVEATSTTPTTIVYTITNTHKPSYDGYFEIRGTVWNDGSPGKGNDINGTCGKEDSTLAGIKVRLKDKNGKLIESSYSNGTDTKYETKSESIFTRTDYAITASDGTYVIRVNYDNSANSKNVYKLYENAETVKDELKTAYVEFEYDGFKYTTVKTSNTGEDTSKAIENETTRNKIDSNTTITPTTSKPGEMPITAITQNVLSFEEYVKVEENVNTTKRTEVIKYCKGDGKTYYRTVWNAAWGTVQTKSHTCANCKKGGHTLRDFEVEVNTIQYVNLGLFEREQPGLIVTSDINNVQVTMNGQQYTYYYNIESDKYSDVDVKVKFQNKLDGENQIYTYKRPMNPADIAYIQNNPNALEVLVTYDIKVGNYSTTLPITINKIINAYDSNYTIVSVKKGNSNVDYTESSYYKESNEFKEITLNGLNITVQPGNQVIEKNDLEVKRANEAKDNDIIKITYSVNIDTIKEKLLQGEATLDNAVEIGEYSTQYGKDTLYAEGRTGGRTNNSYAGYDYDSHPGNAGIYINDYGTLQAEKPEPDTDIAPSFALINDKDKPKTLSGTVWEDLRSHEINQEDKERLGNGKQDDSEKKVQNVKVELYNIDGTLAQIYDEESKIFKEAVAYSSETGEYKLEGVVTGQYFIKYTYGDETTELGSNATTMDGGTTKINARNHKSTIIKDPKIEEVLKKNYTDADFDKTWHLTHTDGYSVAVDNMLDRLDIPDLQYSNFHEKDGATYVEPQNMTAYTKPFMTKVEFDDKDNGEKVKNENGEIDIKTNWDKLDFGIIERPREDLFVEKTISYFKITLANGQVLTEGDPRTQKLNYVKAMGLNQEINSGEDARNILDKRLLAEVDSELIQGAEIEIQYEVNVTNNNEIDYDYGAKEIYEAEINKMIEDGEPEYEKYITRLGNANYYYYGKKEDNDGNALNKMKTEIMFVDYIDKDLVYEEDTSKWVDADIEELTKEGEELINPDAEKAVQNNTHKILISATEPTLVLEIGETSDERSMTARKMLTNKTENTYDNELEIIRIDGKTARTIEKSEGGKQYEKTYKPGSYIPGWSYGTYEQDDDRVNVVITPPTGLTTNYIAYAIGGVVGLIVMLVGVIFIKKKVLIK